MTKKEKIKKRVLQIINTLDPSGSNANRYSKLFDNMSEKQLKVYIESIKAKSTQLYIVMPNLELHLNMNNIKTAAELTKTQLLSRLWRTDKHSGEKYLSPEEYFILNIPIKRLQQTVDKKISVDDNDDRLDNTTGTLVKQNSAAGISSPEIQCLFAQGLDKSLTELLKLRGGDIAAYGEFKRQLEDTGSVSMDRISKGSSTRSVVVTDVLFKGMHIKTNFSDVIAGVPNE